MITTISSERLVVISDLHLGNPFSRAKKKTIQFLDWASCNGYDICINGDGFEIAQVSFSKLVRDIPDVLQAIKNASKRGAKVYYVVGNHDIIFEHFLNDWGGFKLAPFLNLSSGDKRIRIEHGHLYDPFFIRNPRIYEACTWIAGFLLKIAPSTYHAWIFWEKARSMLWRGKPGITGEHPNFREAVEELCNRGFDSVILGHTHHAGFIKLERGGNYFNPGSWMLDSMYVEVIGGVAQLRRF